jgi:hypothetical protein
MSEFYLGDDAPDLTGSVFGDGSAAELPEVPIVGEGDDVSEGAYGAPDDVDTSVLGNGLEADGQPKVPDAPDTGGAETVEIDQDLLDMSPAAVAELREMLLARASELAAERTSLLGEQDRLIGAETLSLDEELDRLLGGF